ncbi:MAG: hypothetical protein DCC55_22440 [Chloroflexi bacterium]|nr:MAG: hypothetical protein DCC55_22440 [Chloroflexota bacterium]
MSDLLRDNRQPGFCIIDNELLDEYAPRIGAYGVAVYALIVRFAGRKDAAFPSYQTIADRIGISRRKAISTVQALLDMGLIEKTKRVGPTGNTSNLYTLLDLKKPSPGACDAPPGACDAPPGVCDAPPGACDAPPLVHVMHPKKTQLKKTHLLRHREEREAPAHVAPLIDLDLPNPPTEEEMAQRLAEDTGAVSVKVFKHRHASRYANGPHMKGAQLAGEYVVAGKGTNPVQIYHERYSIEQHPLTDPQQDDLIAIVTDLTRWRNTVIQWSQTSYSPKNIRGQLDWYHNGTPTHRTESRNHASNQGTGSNGRPRPHWADYDPKQTEYNPDRAAVLAGWSDEPDIDDYGEYKKQLAAREAAAAG